jgi:hypothetical protein
VLSRVYSNGNVYNGHLWNGIRHGTGFMQYAKGNAYTGDWQDVMRHGDGPDGVWTCWRVYWQLAN